MRTPAGLWAVDLLGRGGVRVNQTRTRAALLRDGATIQIGSSTLCVQGSNQIDRAEKPVRLPAGEVEAGPCSPGVATELAPRGEAERGHLSGSPGLPVPEGDRWHSLERELEQVFAGREPQQIELAKALLVPLAKQFGLLHEQMVRHFQQTASTLLQICEAVPPEQLDGLLVAVDETSRTLVPPSQPSAAAGSLRANSSTAPPSCRPIAPRAHGCTRHSPVARQAMTVHHEPSAPGLDRADDTMHDELHVLLCHRLGTMDSERHGCWRRMLNRLFP